MLTQVVYFYNDMITHLHMYDCTSEAGACKCTHTQFGCSSFWQPEGLGKIFDIRNLQYGQWTRCHTSECNIGSTSCLPSKRCLAALYGFNLQWVTISIGQLPHIVWNALFSRSQECHAFAQCLGLQRLHVGVRRYFAGLSFLTQVLFLGRCPCVDIYAWSDIMEIFISVLMAICYISIYVYICVLLEKLVHCDDVEPLIF